MSLAKMIKETAPRGYILKLNSIWGGFRTKTLLSTSGTPRFVCHSFPLSIGGDELQDYVITPQVSISRLEGD
jgi:hypothetical protein